MDLQMRWMLRRDLPVVQDIEDESFIYPWTAEELADCVLKSRNVVGIVAIMDGLVVGYMIYHLYHTRYVILNMAVRHDYRRLGIGTAFIARIKNKLNPQHRYAITAYVSDINLRCQLFMRSQNMKAVNVLENLFVECDSTYVFRYSIASVFNQKELV